MELPNKRSPGERSDYRDYLSTISNTPRFFPWGPYQESPEGQVANPIFALDSCR